LPRGRAPQAFQLDIGPTRPVEQPDAIAEQDRRDAHEDLVEEARVDALVSDAGAEDVDVLVTGSGLGRRDAALEVTDEGDTRHRSVRGVVGRHELWAGPSPAKRLAFLGRAFVWIVAAKGAVADEKSVDLADNVVTVGLGPRYAVSQDMSPCRPAMKPSSGIVTEYSVLLTIYLHRDQCGWAPLKTVDRAEDSAQVAAVGFRAFT
jgi:hypothetical protein